MFSRKKNQKGEANPGELPVDSVPANAVASSEDVAAAEGAELAPVDTAKSEVVDYPSGIKLALILLSAYVSMFLVALVRT
jgi:hypothetical protein